MKGEDSLRDFWDNIKRINIHIIRLHKENRERNKKKHGDFKSCPQTL